MTSKQVLSKLQDLGEYVKSPSSTVEASVARRLRDAMRAPRAAMPPRPAGPAWRPMAGGNNPYSRPGLPARPAAVPPQRPRPDRPRPALQPMHDDDSFGAALRRAQAASNHNQPRRRETPKSNAWVEVILEHPRGRVTSEYRRGERVVDPIVFEWANGWAREIFEPDDLRAWLDAGLGPNQSTRAAALRSEGWTPAEWARGPGKPRNASPFR
ncbi:hypothetical protein [Pseudonocardia alni]|uniref:hypothetical protein n=1 Tax=Pseudonocardia alni TaxID=33907 RepID=UPI00332FEE52